MAKKRLSNPFGMFRDRLKSLDGMLFTINGTVQGRKVYRVLKGDAIKPRSARQAVLDLAADLEISEREAEEIILHVANVGEDVVHAMNGSVLTIRSVARKNPRRNYSSSLFTSGDLRWSTYEPTKYGLEKTAEYARPGQDTVVYSILKFPEKSAVGTYYGTYRTWHHKDGTTSDYVVTESIGEERAERAAQEDLDGLRRGLLSFKNPKRNPFGFGSRLSALKGQRFDVGGRESDRVSALPVVLRSVDARAAMREVEELVHLRQRDAEDVVLRAAEQGSFSVKNAQTGGFVTVTVSARRK
jgi:hypothetical protein